MAGAIDLGNSFLQGVLLILADLLLHSTCQSSTHMCWCTHTPQPCNNCGCCKRTSTDLHLLALRAGAAMFSLYWTPSVAVRLPPREPIESRWFGAPFCPTGVFSLPPPERSTEASFGRLDDAGALLLPRSSSWLPAQRPAR